MRIREEVDRIRGRGGRELLVHLVTPARCRGTALLLHGIQSHAGWYMDTARHLARSGIHVALPERRGSGLDRRERGDAPSPGALVEDARRVGAHMRWLTGRRPVWIGVSWGGKVALHVARHHPDDVEALALVVPGLRVSIDLSLPERLRVLGLLALGGRGRLPIPLQDPALFSNEAAWRQYVAEDPLALRNATARFFVCSHLLDLGLRQATPLLPPRLRVLLVLARQDAIVNLEETRDLVRACTTGHLETLLLERTRHTPEFGPEASQYQERLVRFCIVGGGALVPPRACGQAAGL